MFSSKLILVDRWLDGMASPFKACKVKGDRLHRAERESEYWYEAEKENCWHIRVCWVRRKKSVSFYYVFHQWMHWEQINRYTGLFAHLHGCEVEYWIINRKKACGVKWKKPRSLCNFYSESNWVSWFYIVYTGIKGTHLICIHNYAHYFCRVYKAEDIP